MTQSIPNLPASTTLAGRSILITGANLGLGYSAALLSLQLGASPVYLAVRTVSKGNDARESLLADAVVKKKNPNAVVEVYELDMSRWDSVQAFASKFTADTKAAGQGLDIALLNAGLANMYFELAPTGNEMTIQVNHLSTALLSLLLLPLLEASTTQQHTARLTIVSSGSHKTANLKTCPPENKNYLSSLNDKSTFGARDRYALSKLLVMFFVRQLSQKVSSDKVIINNVCPGPIKTSLTRSVPIFLKPVMWFLITRHSNPVEKGAACYVHAVECVGKESHGLWYQFMQLAPYSDFVTSKEGEKTQLRIWKETMEVLQKVSPGIGAKL